MVNGSCSSDSGSGRRERLRGERFGAHSAHQYFTLPCGHGRHSAQNRSSFPCVQPTQATQLSRRLPWGHGLHVAQLSFRFPCGHRFITSRSPITIDALAPVVECGGRAKRRRCHVGLTKIDRFVRRPRPNFDDKPSEWVFSRLRFIRFSPVCVRHFWIFLATFIIITLWKVAIILISTGFE